MSEREEYSENHDLFVTDDTDCDIGTDGIPSRVLWIITDFAEKILDSALYSKNFTGSGSNKNVLVLLKTYWFWRKSLECTSVVARPFASLFLSESDSRDSQSFWRLSRLILCCR